MEHKTMPVSVGVILHQDKVLLGKRNAGYYAGFWEFPGGKIEPGETAFDALVRELNEELGIMVSKAREVLNIRETHSNMIIHLSV